MATENDQNSFLEDLYEQELAEVRDFFRPTPVFGPPIHWDDPTLVAQLC
jgi:hypothetical protein